MITNHEGVQLECFLPLIENQEIETSGEDGDGVAGFEQEEEKSDRENMQAFAFKYLGEEAVRTCHRKLDGWWTYELCPLAHIKQFHEENGKVVASFNLGLINAQKTMIEHQTMQAKKGGSDGSSGGTSSSLSSSNAKTISFVFDSGTKCDLNGQPREAVVNFHCSPNSRDSIKQVTETSTCSYVVDFESKELCKHPEFKQTTADINHIHCNLL